MTTKSMFSSNVCTPFLWGAHLYKVRWPLIYLQKVFSQAMCLPNAESGPSLQNELAYDMSTKSMFSSNVCTPLLYGPISIKWVGPLIDLQKASYQAFTQTRIFYKFSHAGVILGEEIFSTKWLPQRHYRESTFQ